MEKNWDKVLATEAAEAGAKIRTFESLHFVGHICKTYFFDWYLDMTGEIPFVFLVLIGLFCAPAYCNQGCGTNYT